MKNPPPSVSAAPQGRVSRFASILLLGLAGLSAARAQSLVYHYAFDETSGVTVSDSAGDRDLALRTVTTWGDGVIPESGGLSLGATAQGTGTGAQGSGLEAINLTQFTFTGWFQVSSAAPQGTLFSLKNSSAHVNQSVFYLTIAGASGNQLRAVGQGGRSILSSTSTIVGGSANQWVFFALTVDSTSASAGTNYVNAVKFYVANADSESLTLLGNSGLSTTTWDDGINGVRPGISGTALVGIDDVVVGNGHGTDSATWRALNQNGRLDDFRLYDGVLDAAALEAVRQQGLTSIPEPASAGLALGLGIFTIALAGRRSRPAA